MSENNNAGSEAVERKERDKKLQQEEWIPKTKLGRQVKDGIIKDIDFILDNSLRITEPEIVDKLLPDIESDMILIGQSKGKFGGGSRRAYKQTQAKTCEGNRLKFTAMVVVGNNDGYVGIGTADSRETVPAREKALARAKMNLIKVRRGCGSWECGCGTAHSIPFSVSGKVGSTEIILKSAPMGVGLCVPSECAKVLRLAGFKDVWSNTFGKTKITINLINACLNALKSLGSFYVSDNYCKEAGIIEGGVQ